jgi:hypothetical protein
MGGWFSRAKAAAAPVRRDFFKELEVSIPLADLNDFDAMNEVYREFCRGDCPARMTVRAVLRSGRKIENRLYRPPKQIASGPLLFHNYSKAARQFRIYFHPTGCDQAITNSRRD